MRDEADVSASNGGDQVTNIEWAQDVWNPVAGCSDVSEGCRNCYARTMAKRLAAMGQQKYEGLTVLQGSKTVWTGKIAFDEKALLAPLRRKKPTRYFVNSMSDLFHPNVTDEMRDRIFAVMALCPQHTFMVLTKRPQRMRKYVIATKARMSYGPPVVIGRQQKLRDQVQALADYADPLQLDHAMVASSGTLDAGYGPLTNVWLGVSVEDQATSDARIPLLLQTPAAIRFVSYEPALEAVDFTQFLRCCCVCNVLNTDPDECAFLYRNHEDSRTKLDLIIVGGESGPKARPCNVEWIRKAVQQCKAAGVACYVKQLGAKPYQQGTAPFPTHYPIKDRKGGDMSEWPEDLRIREMPEVAA